MSRLYDDGNQVAAMSLKNLYRRQYFLFWYDPKDSQLPLAKRLLSNTCFFLPTTFAVHTVTGKSLALWNFLAYYRAKNLRHLKTNGGLLFSRSAACFSQIQSLFCSKGASLIYRSSPWITSFSFKFSEMSWSDLKFLIVNSCTWLDLISMNSDFCNCNLRECNDQSWLGVLFPSLSLNFASAIWGNAMTKVCGGFFLWGGVGGSVSFHVSGAGFASDNTFGTSQGNLKIYLRKLVTHDIQWSNEENLLI